MLTQLPWMFRLRRTRGWFARGYLGLFRRSGGLVATTERPDLVDLAYGDDALQRLDLWLPDMPSRGIVMWVHGGGWRAADKDDEAGVAATLAASLRAAGFAVAVPNHRLAPDVPALAQQDDLDLAFAAVIADPRLTGQVTLLGHSSGGWHALRLAVRLGAHPRLDAVIGLGAALAPASLAANPVFARAMVRPAFGRDRGVWADAAVDLDAVAVPVTLYVGVDDHEMLTDHRAAAARAPSHLEVIEVAGVDHFSIVTRARVDPERVLRSAWVWPGSHGYEGVDIRMHGSAHLGDRSWSRGR